MALLTVLVSLLFLTSYYSDGNQECIVVSSSDGHNDPSCLQNNGSNHSYCQSLEYVFDNPMLLDDKEVIVKGVQWLRKTLTISGVGNLKLSGDDHKTSAIKCSTSCGTKQDGCGLMFALVSGLQLVNITFEGCGTFQNSTTIRNFTNVKYYSAVYIINSTNLSLSYTTFKKSSGRAISIHDVDGNVSISNSTFMENVYHSDGYDALFGGGSIYIEFTYCSPGYTSCDPETNTHNKHSRYFITNCTFQDNLATNKEKTNQSHIVQFRILPGSDGNNAGQGGGIHLVIKGWSFNNSVVVEHCVFYNNSAIWGGGIDTLFLDNANRNIFTVRNCIFKKCSALARAGGALQLGFYGVNTVTENSITIEDTIFINNSAGWGGAASFFSSLSQSDPNNSLMFIDNYFEGNSASLGAAIHLSPEAMQYFHDGITTNAQFHNCVFVKNEVVKSATFLNIANDNSSHHVVESGIFHIESLKVDLSSTIRFALNKGSAIVAVSGEINVRETGKVIFVKNTATNGGAMSLIGFSVLELHPGSCVLFEGNTASEYGGAVYSISPHQSIFLKSHKCFISYTGVNSNDPNKWNATLVFDSNYAKYGLAIFADSVLPCVKQIGAIYTDVRTAFQWESFKILPDIQQYTIATSPTAIEFHLPQDIAPGENIYINLTSFDDLHQPIPSSFQITINSNEGVTTPNSFISEEGHLQIRGSPGKTFSLTLLTQNTRHVSATKTGRLGDCPLGFVLDEDVCTCETGQKADLVGVVECRTAMFQTQLQVGYWIGCRGSKPLTGLCPLGYCNYDAYSTSGVFPVPRTCKDLQQSELCDNNRKGQLCGECKDEFAAHFNSEKFSCGRCSYGAIGLLIYLVAELVPLILVFALVMTFKINITSGQMQSFLLFAQTFFILNHVPSLRSHSEITHVLISVHTLIVGFFNLFFFHMDEMSFCLWSGASILDSIAFRYVTTLFTILLLTFFIIATNRGVFRMTLFDGRFSKFKRVAKRLSPEQNSIIHGISAFLILSYTQFTLTSLQILNKGSLYTHGGVVDISVVYLQGNLEYFGVDHLKYAIPALLVLTFLSLPPPLLLIAYPLLWKVKAKLKFKVNNENETTMWPIRKLLPLIDSFQGVFKDNCRMFSGLLFLWRFIIIAIYAFSSTLTELFLLMEVALVAILGIHTIVRPYKKKIQNIVDGVMFLNMALVILLKWYTSVPSIGNVDSQVLNFIVFIQLLLMYAPLVCIGIYATYRLLKWLHLMPQNIKFMSHMTGHEINIECEKSPKKSLKRQPTSPDEEIFERASEINTVASSVTCSEAGFDFGTDRRTSTLMTTQ